MTYNLRKAHLSDANALAQFLKELGWFARLAAEPVEKVADTVHRHLSLCLADNSHSVYVAESDNGELVGYVSVHWLPYLFHPGPEGYISELFIHEAARGQGLGTRLLETVKQEAVERGCYRLSLLNNKQRESYQRGFYEKQGWEEREDMVNFVYWLPG
jgi:GNAT superfamily N-acetyltransferase